MHVGVWCAPTLAAVVSVDVLVCWCCSVSRSVNPVESGVVTCGTIHGGFAPNVIADSVRVEGA